MNPFQRHIAWLENNFHEIFDGPEIALDLRYATPHNFMNKNLYAGFKRCFLHPEAFEKLTQAQALLSKHRNNYKFRIWDATRPQSIQKQMYDHLQGGPFEAYVAKPSPGSMHNFGLAIDLTLQNEKGECLPMGTDFDDFRDLAQPKKEHQLLESGDLKKEELENRLLLRNVMEEAGFKVLPHEWWHFNALPSDEVHGLYKILE